VAKSIRRPAARSPFLSPLDPKSTFAVVRCSLFGNPAGTAARRSYSAPVASQGPAHKVRLPHIRSVFAAAVAAAATAAQGPNHAHKAGPEPPWRTHACQYLHSPVSKNKPHHPKFGFA
jgi:hypothetical protein